MIKKIEIAGIQLENYTAHESMVQIGENLDSQVFHMVEEVTTAMLLAAGNDERLKEALESVDHAVIAEAEVLEAAGIRDMQRKREIEGRDIFCGLMQLIERGQKKIFLLGDTVAVTEQVYEYLQREFRECQISGIFAMEECVGASEAAANEINAAAVDVVICVIRSPERAYFLLDNKDKISAALWYGVDRERLLPKRGHLLRWMGRRIRRKKLTEYISSYGKKDEA